MNKELLDAILDNCKNNNIKILNPLYIKEGGKLGQSGDFQIVIMKEHNTEKYFFGMGFGVSFDNAHLTKEEALKYFIDNLIEKSKNSDLQFVSLVIPRRAVELAEMVDCHNVLIRHIIDYLPMCDMLADRWDILIKLHDIKIEVN